MIALAFKLAHMPLSQDLHDQIFDDFLKDYSKNLANQTHLFEGLTTVLDELDANGYSFAVCTNKMHGMAVPLLEKLGILHRFLSITGGDSFEFRKPDRRHLEKTAELAGFSLDQAIMIGDSSTDINAAINAGIPSIAVTFGYSDLPVETLGANIIISHFDQLIRAIRAIQN